jgi:nucleotide-binding universal stress UspA family protein
LFFALFLVLRLQPAKDQERKTKGNPFEGSDTMLQICGILHPTDFSDLSNNAFRVACGLAEDYHAPLYILHVATTFEAYKNELAFEKHSEQYLAKDWEKLGEHQWPGIEIRRLLEEGEPAEQIVRVSHSIPCDFIVMGSHGRSRLPRLLLGSVAEHVLREATCPVMIVRAPFPAADNSLPKTA